MWGTYRQLRDLNGGRACEGVDLSVTIARHLSLVEVARCVLFARERGMLIVARSKLCAYFDSASASAHTLEDCLPRTLSLGYAHLDGTD